MVDLRGSRERVRDRSADDLPRHYEAVRLNPRAAAAGWLAAVLLLAGAVGLPYLAPGGGARAAAGVMGTAAVLLLFGLVRCRCHEVSVGSTWLEIRLGPFHRKPPLGLLTAARARVATSWRRLYADREVVLELAGERLLVPSRDPEELMGAIRPGGDRGPEG